MPRLLFPTGKNTTMRDALFLMEFSWESLLRNDKHPIIRKHAFLLRWHILRHVHIYRWDWVRMERFMRFGCWWREYMLGGNWDMAAFLDKVVRLFHITTSIERQYLLDERLLFYILSRTYPWGRYYISMSRKQGTTSTVADAYALSHIRTVLLSLNIELRTPLLIEH